MRVIIKIVIAAAIAGLALVLVLNALVFAPLITGKADLPPLPDLAALEAKQAEEKEKNAEAGEPAPKEAAAKAPDQNPATEKTGAGNQAKEGNADESAPLKAASVETLSAAQTASERPSEALSLAAKKYSVIAPDGETYTSDAPIYIICRCGEKFSSGAEWQAHFSYYSAFRCACGMSFSAISGWESHAGIYDPNTFMYTGKTYAEAASEGHALTNEQTHEAEYNAHAGWRTGP